MIKKCSNVFLYTWLVHRHASYTERINIIGLKIPAGGRQISWLFTSMTEELNHGLPRNNSSLVVTAGLEPATSGFQVWRPNHFAMLHILQRFKIIFVVFKVVRFGCYFLGLQVTNKKQTVSINFTHNLSEIQMHVKVHNIY